MLKRIERVLIKVPDLVEAVRFYEEVFGLSHLWEDEDSVGLRFPETQTELVLHVNEDIPPELNVQYLVEDVTEAVRAFGEKGCRIVLEPFDMPAGRGAVIEDPYGNTLSLQDLTRGGRPPPTE